MTRPWILSVFFAIAACQTSDRREQANAPAPGPTAAPAPAVVVASAAHPSPVEELDRLDRRKPLPLLPMMANHQKQNMREHLEVVQAIVAAMASRNFDRVAQSARRMGYSETMGRMCEHMGAAAPGFSDQALAFHHSADQIAEAAKRQDSEAVLSALGETLAMCTGCHATYKQKLVDKLD